jgi:hypothetical protein
MFKPPTPREIIDGIINGTINIDDIKHIGNATWMELIDKKPALISKMPTRYLTPEIIMKHGSVDQILHYSHKYDIEPTTWMRVLNTNMDNIKSIPRVLQTKEMIDSIREIIPVKLIQYIRADLIDDDMLIMAVLNRWTPDYVFQGFYFNNLPSDYKITPEFVYKCIDTAHKLGCNTRNIITITGLPDHLMEMHDIQDAFIKHWIFHYNSITNISPTVWKHILSRNPYDIRNINNPTFEMWMYVIDIAIASRNCDDIFTCLASIIPHDVMVAIFEKHGYNYMIYFKNISEEHVITCINNSSSDDIGIIKYIQNDILSLDMCITAVKKNGLALFYIKNQTFLMCLYAVKQNPDAIEYVSDKFYGDVKNALKEGIDDAIDEYITYKKDIHLNELYNKNVQGSVYRICYNIECYHYHKKGANLPDNHESNIVYRACEVGYLRKGNWAFCKTEIDVSPKEANRYIQCNMMSGQCTRGGKMFIKSVHVI